MYIYIYVHTYIYIYIYIYYHVIPSEFLNFNIVIIRKLIDQIASLFEKVLLK